MVDGFERAVFASAGDTPERGAVIAKTHELLARAKDHGLARDEVMSIMRQLP